MQDRLKAVRKSLKKTQSEFGKTLGCSRDTIANYEGGRAVPTDTFLQLICAKFPINEEWLRTGKGVMTLDTETSLFAAFSKQYELTAAEQQVARYLLALSPDERKHILKHLRGLSDAIEHADEESAAKAAAREAKVEEYRQELEAQEKGPPASETFDGEKRA
ncbi:MAG: helix-turn-helix domain-containing protein [Selenomonadaceae bacterium]|nr:helix-turn-helix domain-containing protein [Selenomonadaceae bacterium]